MPFAFLSAALVALAGLTLRSAWAPPGSPAWHLPLAAALALVHWGGPRAAAGAAAGLALAYAGAGLPAPVTLALTLAGAGAAALSWLLAARLAAARCWLPAMPDLVAFLVLGLLVPLALHSLLVVAWLVAAEELPADRWAPAAVATAACALLAGVIVTVPALVFASRPLARAGLFHPPGGWRALPPPSLLRGLPRPELHALAAVGLFVGALFPCLFHSDDTTWALHHLFLLVVPLRYGLPLAALAAAWSALLTLYLPTPLAGPLSTPLSLAAQTHPLLLIALRCAGGLIIGRAAGDARRAEADVRALNAGLEERIAARTAELGQSEARYRALFEGTSVGIVLADAADGRCLDCNSAAVALLGAPGRAALIGRLPGDRPLPLQPGGEDTAGLFARMFAQARAGGSSRFEWTTRTWAGMDFHAEVFCTALEVGGRLLIQVVMNDITARKNAEEALRRSEHRLALALDASNKALDEARAAHRAAEAAARAERELIARLSHELRTPLNGIIGPVDLLAATALTDAQRRYLGLARDSAGRLLALIDDVLQLAGPPGDRGPPPLARSPAPTEALAGRRVLIVEDNRINAEVALAVLRGAGLRCDLARDGAAGVAAFERDDYDLVLMDCQLPVLDGPEAARRIRALPGRRRVPIVALTATATPENRQACAEAGMDEYLSKPFNAPELLRVIARLLGAGPPADAPAPGLPPPPPDGPGPAGPAPAWSRQAALARLGGREALLARVAAQFLAGRAEALALVRQALEAADAPALKAAAHRLKGQAATFEARGVVEAAARLEDAAGRGELADAPAMAARLEAELARLAPELEAFAAAPRA